MKKILITLSGSGSVGKTRTLKLVKDKIVEDYNVSESNIEHLYPKGKDIRVILKSVGDLKKKIGINTAGDDNYYAKKSIELFEKYDCDIVICATRASIKTNEGSISTIQKYCLNNQDSITLIPLFKMYQSGSSEEENNDNENDKKMVEIIMDQLTRFL